MRHTPLLVVLALAGCGYHFTGEKLGLPDDIHSLSVGTIVNRSREYGLEKTLAFTMEREIHERGHFRMAQDPADGDAVLTGTIRDLRVRPVAFDANDQAVQYEIKVVLDFVLTRQRDGHALWRVSELQETDEYSASARVVVTSSSQFQRGTLDAADVQNPQFTHIQLAETERSQAITRALNQAVRDAYNQMVENF
ncbi:MAG: LPS assembly lipoprotein LptE [Candidatus Binatia bacterium]